MEGVLIIQDLSKKRNFIVEKYEEIRAAKINHMKVEFAK